MYTLLHDGFEIRRGLLEKELLIQLRKEADLVSRKANSTCVRHIRKFSKIFDGLSVEGNIRSLISNEFIPVRSILFNKTVEENWPVAWHQDVTIAVKAKFDCEDYNNWSIKSGVPHVQPPLTLLQNMVTIRIHLDDTFEDNGALRVVPGSHMNGKLTTEELTLIDKNAAYTCSCEAGDVLIMKPLLLHSSYKSKNPDKRRVLHFEYAKKDDLHCKLNWFETDK